MSDKFNIWDSIALQDSVKLALQLRAKIEDICLANQCTTKDLPDSLIPTHQLYMLALSYEATYNKVLELELVKTGNLKSNHNNIH